MYGYTPPTVIAIDPDLLLDAGAFQRVAWALARELRNRPTWVVVKAPEAITLDEDPEVAMEACLRLPSDDVPAGDAGAAEVLRRHLADLGVMVHIEPVPEGPTPHSPASAIVAGSWRDAANIAKLAGSGTVIGWTLEPGWVPDSVAGVPFVAVRPDRAVASA